MGAYEGYPEIKGKTFLKAFWLLHDLVLYPAILQTLTNWTEIWLEPPQLVRRLLSPFVAFLVLEEIFFLTYIISAVLIVCTVLCIRTEKRAGHSIRAEIAVFSVFLVFCVIGLLSSRQFLNAAMSI